MTGRAIVSGHHMAKKALAELAAAPLEFLSS